MVMSQVIMVVMIFGSLKLTRQVIYNGKNVWVERVMMKVQRLFKLPMMAILLLELQNRQTEMFGDYMGIPMHGWLSLIRMEIYNGKNVGVVVVEQRQIIRSR